MLLTVSASLGLYNLKFDKHTLEDFHYLMENMSKEYLLSLAVIILSTIQRENFKYNRTCVISDILEHPFLESYDNGNKKYSKELVMCFIEKSHISSLLTRITSDGDDENYYTLRELSNKRLKYR